MSTDRGRIRITGFDADRVESREPLSDWTEQRGTETESRWGRAWREFRDNRSAMLGLYTVALMSVS
ncbi:oligopeptide transport permease C-like protein [Haloarcula quadrata]|uniref:Oligopeptide transport permease C-like protein n=1 Tax=Haloarcula quadrata TaxID=182779 RepID=A0A495R3I0_9EURY|nr:hypothetical protein [Haloarcula quadrata]RKS81779.1 oligopeptide transport permease C-like protein [Haloarcula quadrata]